jgi:hypothetical protein
LIRDSLEEMVAKSEATPIAHTQSRCIYIAILDLLQTADSVGDARVWLIDCQKVCRCCRNPLTKALLDVMHGSPNALKSVI